MRFTNIKIGDKVVLKTSEIKSRLSHKWYEYCCRPGGLVVQKDYDNVIQLAMLAAMEPLVGTVINYGAGNCVGVVFEVDSIKDFSYYEARDLNEFKVD